MSDVTKFGAMFLLSLCMTLTACGGGGGGSDNGGGGGDVVDGGDTDGDTDGDTGGDDDGDTGGDDGGTDEPVDENAPVVTVSSPAMKQLNFAWDAHEGDEYYVLSQDPTGDSGFSEVMQIDEGTEATMDVSVHEHDGADTAFIVEACDANDECIPSAAVSATEALISAIGYFKASNTGPTDEFGQSVALSEDGMTLVVGAHDEQSGDPADQGNNDITSAGAVYVFTKTEEGWEQQAYLKARASEIAREDDFGHSIALSADGNTLAVGAPWEENSTLSDEDDVGAVYVFVREDGTWTEQAYLHAATMRTSQHFGVSVSLSDDGNLLAVGAEGLPEGSFTQEDGTVVTTPAVAGTVHLHTRSPEGVWDEVAELPATDPSGLFGHKVALSGDGSVLAVGAARESTGAGGDATEDTAVTAGAVYIYGQADGAWTEQGYLQSSTAEADGLFGSALAISDSGDLLAVGAIGEEDEAGAVHLFGGSDGNWTHQARLVGSNTKEDDAFGADVALAADGSMLAVGATHEDSPARGVGGDETIGDGGANSGAVYTFAAADGEWLQAAYVKAPNTQAQAMFGHSVALDATGDSLAVGAIGEDGSSMGVGGDQTATFSAEETADIGTGAGAVYLY